MKVFQLKYVAAFTCLISFNCWSQYKTTFPLNQNVVSGTLKNGMKYYVLHNEWPKERACFYFVQNVGAILENDNQNGLAHFLEHMAFNGTKNFPDKGVINMLEKNGVRFGADINAYTDVDETVYNLSNVPTTNQKLIDSSLLVLHDWSGFLSLKDKEIDAERGVIREEWRTRRDASFRLRLQTDKVLYKGSKYADRDVIGDLNIINTFEHKALKDYYAKWYRPDLQAVVVVGDVDAKEIEKKIIAMFSDIKMPANPAERYYVSIPENKKMDFLIAKDKEVGQMNVALSFKKKYPLVKDETWEQKQLINSLCANMLNRRYQNYLKNGDKAALAIQAGEGGISRLEYTFGLYVSPKNGQTETAFLEMMTEFERAKRFGFVASEFERNKKEIISYYENLLRNQDKLNSDDLSMGLAYYYLKADPFQEDRVSFEDTKRRLSTITLEQINAAVKELQTNENVFLSVTGSDKENTVYPTQAALEKIIADVKTMPLEAYKETTVDEKLISETLKGSKVVKESVIEDLPNAKKYVLENGATVVLYKTALSQDEVLFSAYSNGGSSLIKTEDIPSSQIAISLSDNSGLGNFDVEALTDKLTGKNVAIKPTLNAVQEGFQGNSSKQDVETLLQLLYMQFEQPRFDENQYTKMVTKLQNSLDNNLTNDNKVYTDTISLLNSNHNPRVPIFDQKYMSQLDFNKAQQIYKERFQNAADFNFFFVGNFPDNMLELVQQYIGSIFSDKNQLETFKNISITPKKGISKSTILRDMAVPKTSIYLRLTKESAYTLEDNLKLYLIKELLSKKYLEIIRESEGGSYGVNVSTSFKRLPVSNFSMEISFDSNPEKSDKLLKVVYEQIALIQKNLGNAEDIKSIKNTLLKLNKESIDKNSFWLSKLISKSLYNEPIVTETAYEKIVNDITAEDIRTYAKKIFADPNIVEVMMRPKTK
ncbi:insulinase family protein [Flavobacterium sp. MC2016-06]|uniref:M16 family metallopeptidase n=1 Tax=Flavobacterium sp. MC2016-06 TaxID=2676308 RepID=UPI0012BA5C14|nr:M16 family metallopeptidase [Flavobacterium sp. MC2016-06]MBU3862186.1 insulinase family protein [Flavobacterium sp. MC2016-06]